MGGHEHALPGQLLRSPNQGARRRVRVPRHRQGARQDHFDPQREAHRVPDSREARRKEPHEQAPSVRGGDQGDAPHRREGGARPSSHREMAGGRPGRLWSRHSVVGNLLRREGDARQPDGLPPGQPRLLPQVLLFPGALSERGDGPRKRGLVQRLSHLLPERRVSIREQPLQEDRPQPSRPLREARARVRQFLPKTRAHP